MTKLTIADVRAKFPQYADVPDEQLLEGVRRKFYNDIPREKFFADFGMQAAPSPAPDRAPPRAPRAPMVDTTAPQAPASPEAALVDLMQPPAAPTLGTAPARQSAPAMPVPSQPDAVLPPVATGPSRLAEVAPPARPPALTLEAQPKADTRFTPRATLAPADDPLIAAMTAPQPQPAATSSRDLTESRAPSDPFEGEGIGALATRRGQQFTQGATDVVAAVPEAMAITGEMADRSRAAGAGETLDMRAQMIADIEEALQDPNLPPESRAIMERNLADLTEGQGVLQGMEAAPIVPAQERGLYGAGDTIRQAVEGVVGAPDPRDRGFWGQVATGAGNMTGMVAASVAGSAVGGPVGGLAVGAGTGAAMNQSQVFEEALQSGADQETALQAAKWATLIGASEIIPINRALKLLPPRIRGELTTGMMRKFVDIAQASGEEAAQEYLATVANNIVAQQLYDPERGWTEGATDAALVGAVLGGGIGTAGVAMEGRGGGVPPVTAPPRAPAQPQTPEEELAAIMGAPTPAPAPAAPAQPAQPQAEAAPAQPAAPPPASPEADMAAAMGAESGSRSANPEPAPEADIAAAMAPPTELPTPPAAPAREPAAPPQTGAPIPDPTKAAVGARVRVSIGGQDPFAAEIIGQTRNGPRIREADGTVTVLPLDEIEDGAITMSEAVAEAASAPAPQQEAPAEGGRFEILDEIENTPGGPVATGRKVRIDLETGQATVVGADATPAQAGGAPGAVQGAGTQPQAEGVPVGAGAVPPAADRAPEDDLAAAMRAAPKTEESQPVQPTYGVGTFERPAEGDRPAAKIEVTREGPFDFATRFPAPDPRLLDALEREGRNSFEGDPTPEQVASILDEAMADAEQTYAATQAWQAEAEQLAKVTKPSSQIPSGKNSREAIKLEIAQKAVLRGQRDFDDTVATIADVWGMDAAQQFRDEAIRRAGGIAGEPIQWPNEGPKPTAPAAPESEIAAAMGAQPAPAQAAPAPAARPVADRITDEAGRAGLPLTDVSRGQIEAMLPENPSDQDIRTAVEAQGSITASVAAVRPQPAPQRPADPMPEIDSIDINPVRRDTARTPAGTSIDVEYAIVELDDLIASNLPDGRVNPNYPRERQPRDRTKDASERQIQRIMRDFDPRQLLESPTTDTGAMIVDRSGYVESGNGRTLALQRIHAERPDLVDMYRAALKAEGYPIDGMDNPILVRIRRTEMTPAEIEAYTRESNTDTKLAMSATEQAMSDAAALPDSALDLYRGGDIDAAGNRDFVRAFIQAVVTENEQGKMIAPDGSMSQDAVRRVQAALLAKAYGDPALVAKLIESADNNIKSIGGALLDVSASWAKMRSAARAGTIAPEMDQTDALIEAVRLVDRARTERRNVIEYVKQPDLLSGEGISPMGQRFLALMFRDTRQWTKPAGRDRIVAALQFYGDEAMKTAPGADMFGAEANPTATLDLAKEKQDGDEKGQGGQQSDLFAPQPAGSDGAGVREAAGRRDGPGTVEPVEGFGGERPAGQPEGVTALDPAETTPDPTTRQQRRRERATKAQMSMEAQAATSEILRLMPRLRAELDRLDLKRVKLYLDDTDPDWQGMFQVTGDGDFEVVIGAALDPMKTLHHEVIHILRQMNLFTVQEWRALELAAENWLEKHDIVARYPLLNHEERLEEAIAEEFSWALEKLRPPKGNLLVQAFNKIHRLLKAIRNVFRGAGFNTPEDIFGRILSGEISKRQAWNTGYYARMGYNLQAAPLPPAAAVEDLSRRIRDEFGLRDLSLFLSGENLKINMIAVDRDQQGEGRGSDAMRRIIGFADAHSLRVILSPGQRDDGFGTTSRARLVKFYKRFGFVENKGRAKDFTISEGMYREPVRMSRQQARETPRTAEDTFAAQIMMELAQVDDLFQNPISTATTLKGVFADIDPTIRVDGPLPADDPRAEGKDADRVTMFTTATDKPFYIMETAREVWIDVSELGKGEGGNRIYSAVSDYAFNTGKVFIGDPEGLSATALRRRTDNMLSTALKHGTTRHIEPHQYQRDGDAKRGVPALRWTEGDDLGNVQRMIEVSVSSLINLVPQVADARYDFQTGTFRTGEGQPVTAETMADWALVSERSGTPSVGARTLKRGILLNTLSRAESGERPGILERSLRQPSRLVTQGGLRRTFYQARTSGQAAPRPQPEDQPQEAVAPIEGNTAAERIAAANAMFGPPAGWVQPPLPSTWTLPIRTGLMRVREGFQDKFIYLRAAQAQIEEATGERIPDDMNASLKETLFQPRVAERLDRLFKGEVKAVFDAMAKAKKQFGVTREDLWVYMVAKHAPERNAVMAKRDPERFANGNGSGVYDEAAAALLADLDAQGKTPHLEKLAAMLRRLLDDDLEHRRLNGLISDAQFKSYKEMYQHYVPLRGFAERDEGDQIGRLGSGFDMRGKEVRTALGRTSIADDPISQIIVMRQEGIIRAEKNRVGRAMLKLAQKYPAPGLWEVVGKLPTRNMLDAETGEVRKIVDFGAVDQNHTLAVKVGGEVQYLRIDDPLLLAAFNNLSGDTSVAEKWLKVMQMILKTTARAVRIVSSTSTGLNPNFTIPNAQSDFIEGIWTAYNVDKKGMAAAYAKAYLPSLIESVRDEFGDAFDAVRGRIMKRHNVSEDEYRQMRAYVEEWKLSGGRTAFFGFRDLEEISDDIAREMRRHGRKGWREASFGEKVETAKDLGAAPFRGLIAVLDKINQPVESAGRLAMYIAARKNGLSKEQAAALSLDATSNYYRKGHYTPALRALYAFINPAIQSLEKQGRFSVQKSLRKAGAMTLNWKNWVKVFTPVVVVGYVLAEINIAFGDDEDDDPEGVSLYERVSEFDRHRNMMIPIGIEYDEVFDPTQLDAQGNPVKVRVPRLKTVNWRMAYPLRPFLALGSELALARHGRRSASDVVKNVGKSMLMAWNPMADSQPENMLAPTILDPFIDMRLNRNFMDSPITPEDTYGNNKGLPNSSQFYERSNSTAAIELAQFLNRATGGTKFEPGLIDIYPGQLDYMYRFFTGGVGTFVEQLGGVAADAWTGTPTEAKNIPVLRSFVTRTGNMAESEFYYDAKDEVTELQNRMRAAHKALEVDPNDEEAKALFDRLAKELNASVGENGKFIWKDSLIKPFEDADEKLKELRAELTATITNDNLSRPKIADTAKHLRLEMEQVQRKAREQYIEMRTRNLSLVPESD